MIRVRFHNPTSFSPHDWFPVAVRTGALGDAPQAEFLADNGLRCPAVKAQQVGRVSTIYQVKIPFAPQQILEGQLYPKVDESTDEPLRFAYHPWVTDSIGALLPNVLIYKGGKVYTVPMSRLGNPKEQLLPKYKYKHVVDTPARQRWEFRAQHELQGFHVEGAATFVRESPVIELDLVLVWSDQNNPEHDYYVDAIGFQTGELTKLDFAVPNGHPTPNPVRIKDTWVHAVAGRIGFVDGSGLPLVGRLLCLPQTDLDADRDPEFESEDLDYEDEAWRSEIREHDWLQSLWAAETEQIYGVALTDWEGGWLAHSNVPRTRGIPSFELPTLMAKLDRAADRPTAHGWYEKRPQGLLPYAGSTGSQEEFGATKGWPAIVAGEPRWLHLSTYSVVSQLFRGFCLYEPDGERLQLDKHPSWATWSQYTHWSPGRSRDRLGKRGLRRGDRKATRYSGTDDQHREENNLPALYALTGRWIFKYLMEQASTVDMAHFRLRRKVGIGATRAVARLAQSWANYITVSDEGSETDRRYHFLLVWLRDQVWQRFEGHRTKGDVQIVKWKADPRDGVQDPATGKALPNWPVWEHALFVRGAYAAYKVTQDQDWIELALKVARTIVRYGFYKRGNKWVSVNNVHYPIPGRTPIDGFTEADVGKALPPDLYGPRSWAIHEGSIFEPVVPVLVFLEIVPRESDDPDRNRAREIARQYTGGQEALDFKTAEWWATVGTPIADLVK